MPLIGNDIEKISRVGRVIAASPRFVEKVFTRAERDYCKSKGSPAQHYTARFCAKEAFAKAVGVPLSWQEVEVVRTDSGRPVIRTYGRAAEILAGREVRVSLSHAGDYAIATVLIAD